MSDQSPSPVQVPVDPKHHAALKAKLVRLEQLCGLAHTDAEGTLHHVPAWLRPTEGEPRWPVTLAVVAVIVLQVVAPKRFAFDPRWLLPGLETLLVVLLTIANPRRINQERRWLRTLGLLLVVAASVATAYSAGRLVYLLATGHGEPAGVKNPAFQLLLTGGAVWLTNVIVFSLWYWEFDRGGPAARAAARHPHPDFLFTQMTAPEMTHRDWEPSYVDYLYLSFTNATAFSPTDTLPLTAWAKLTMMVQSFISLVTVALVVARAVNIFT